MNFAVISDAALQRVSLGAAVWLVLSSRPGLARPANFPILALIRLCGAPR